MVNFKNKKGGIGIILLFIIIFTTVITTLIVFTETKTLDIKRRNIQNTVLSANLSLYDVVEQGDKTTMLNYRPDELTAYITNPSTIPKNERNNILNLLSSEYFPEGERYKAVYLEKDKALAKFKEYLCKNLKIKEVSNNIFIPINDQKYFIKQIELKEFFVHNSVDVWDQDKTNLNNDIINNKTTCVHVYIVVTVYNGVKIYDFKGTTDVPIHLDTDITIFRSKQ